MLRKLVMLGVCIGAAASVPVFLERNPEAVAALARKGLGGDEPFPSAEPQPGKLRASSLSAPGRTVSIAVDASGHFRAEFKINGRRVTGMVDTGATVVALNESTARRLGLKLKAADFRHEVRTANGSTRAAAVVLQSLSLGRIHLDNVEAVVLEDRALSGTLVGMSVLKRLDGYRVENGTLVLRQ